MILRRRRPPAAPEPDALPVEALGLSVRLRRNPRATRFTLSVSRVDGRPQLTLPQRASLAEARAFLDRHVGWLQGAVARVPPVRVVADGRALPYRGGSVVLESRPGRFAPKLEGGRLLVCGAPEAAAGRAKAFLKDAARAALVPAAHGYAAQVARNATRITLRDTRSRWGSCSSEGALSFSWRLAMAPPEVLDYVAAHEAAHLVEMNHGPGFWALVERLRPDWRESRDWLRRHGGDLHRVDFGG
ncbi:SprT family zinc-dependent metalloprotease [uncultured Albimonas sp.]|uniref:M48 family metallopeptidase n=1 Tax=uncultured Albimonas sp. TaxID=1331701 RepID=UPI0030ECE2EA